MKRVIIALTLVAVIAAGAFAGGQPEAPALGTEENPIVWALVPSGETQAILSGADEVVEMLEEMTGYAFEAIVATDYSGVIEALSSEPPTAHMTALNTFGAIVAIQRGVADVRLVAVRRGRPFYDGQFVARADLGLTSVADMAGIDGLTFARPDPNSTSGWIVPSIVLAANGINPSTDLEEVVDAGGHPAVVTAIYSGSADVGATFIDARSGVAEQYPDVEEVVVVVEEFGPIPNDGIQFSTQIESAMVDSIVDALLAIAATEEGAAALDSIYNWNELIAQDNSFYDPFLQILEASGMDMEQFLD